MPTQYRLTEAETQLILNDSRLYADLPVDLSWCPVRQIPDALEVMDYELTPIEPPAGSMLGEHAWGVATARTQTKRNVVSYRYEFSFPKTELAIAQRNGYELIKDNLAVGMKTMNKWIASLLFQGTQTRDRVNISGMLDLGEDIAGSAYIWDTAGQPTLCVLEAVTDLLDNHYAPPYKMIMSWNLYAGFNALHNAAGSVSHADLASKNYQATVATYAHLGTSAFGTGGTGWQIYPLPAPGADDGRFIMFQNSPENFYMAQVTNGVEISPLTFEPETNMYRTFMEWRGTPVFRGATVDTAGSAEYIVFEPSINLA